MKTYMMAAMTVLLAWTMWADNVWEDWQKPSLYGVSFESYVNGETLSDKGARGGTWGTVPAAAETAAVVSSLRSYMEIETASNELTFVPDSAGERMLKSVNMTVRLNPYEQSLPQIPAAAKSAFAVYAPEDAEATFVGWCKSGWVPLSLASGAYTPETTSWCNMSVKFLRTKEGKVRVQYRMKVGDEYEPLLTEGGDSWLDAPDGVYDSALSRIAFVGSGGIEYLWGSEPRRGLLVSIVPWRELIIDETVYYHDTGTWKVFDYETHKWVDTPPVSGDAYKIAVENGQDYLYFKPTKDWTEDVVVIEFAVRFTMPDFEDEYLEDACALVRMVEDPDSAETTGDPDCRFSCLVGDKWVVNKDVVADPDTDYTVEMTVDRANSTVAYRVKKGRGVEGGVYQNLCSGPTTVVEPLLTFFAGHGYVYEIKSGQRKVK